MAARATRGAAHGTRGATHGTYRSGFAFGIVNFLAIAMLALVSAVATARIYGVRVIGEFALVSAPVAALWVLSTAKEQAALIREITGLPPRHPRITELFAAVFAFSSGLTLVMGLLDGFVSSRVFEGPLHHPELVAPMLVSVAGYVVVTNTGWNLDSIFSAFVAGRQLLLVRLHETVAFLLIAIAVGIGWRSVWGLVIATIGGSLSALLHRAVAVRPFVCARLDRVGLREGLRCLPGLLRFGLKITPGGISQGISQQAGIWAIASVAPTIVVGAYSRAQTIPDRLQQVNFRIVEVLYPTLVSRRSRGDHEGFDRALWDTTRYALVGLLLIASVAGGSARAVLALFGPDFGRAAPAFALLILYPALAAISSAQTQALLALDKPGLTSIAEVARLGVTLGLTVLLTPTLGITGPAAALLLGFVPTIAFKTALLLPHLTRALSEMWPRAQRLALAVAYAGGFAASSAIEHASSPLLALLAGLPLGALAYVGAFAVCGGVDGRDRARLHEALTWLRGWWESRRRLAPAAT